MPARRPGKPMSGKICSMEANVLDNKNNVLGDIKCFNYLLVPISTTQSAGAAHRASGTVSQVSSQRPERAWFRHSTSSLFLNSPGKGPP